MDKLSKAFVSSLSSMRSCQVFLCSKPMAKQLSPVAITTKAPVALAVGCAIAWCVGPPSMRTTPRISRSGRV